MLRENHNKRKKSMCVNYTTGRFGPGIGHFNVLSLWQEDRQCSYNEIFRRVRVTLVLVAEKTINNMSVCVPAAVIRLQSHLFYAVLYCHALSGCTVFFPTRHDPPPSPWKVMNIKCVIIFCIKRIGYISHCKKHPACQHHSEHWSSCELPLIIFRC